MNSVPSVKKGNKIKIISKDFGEIIADLDYEHSPKTCEALWDALPLDVNMSKWGDELYGTIDLDIAPENPKEECEVGDLAYWLDGSGFCILFGPTPVSTSDKPKLISPGNIFAHFEAKTELITKLRNTSSTTIKIERI